MTEHLNQNLYEAMIEAYIKKHNVDRDTAQREISSLTASIADSVSELDEEQLDD
jgi:hypothetical protein